MSCVFSSSKCAARGGGGCGGVVVRGETEGPRREEESSRWQRERGGRRLYTAGDVDTVEFLAFKATFEGSGGRSTAAVWLHALCVSSARAFDGCLVTKSRLAAARIR